MPQEYVLCCSEAPCGDPRDLRRVIPVTASMPYAGITAAPDDAGRGLPNRVAKAPCRPSERQGFVPTALQGVEAERLHPRVVRRPQQTAPRSAPLPTPNAPHGYPGRGAALPAAGVRVPGVDDYALREGDPYATIPVDLEGRRPVDAEKTIAAHHPCIRKAFTTPPVVAESATAAGGTAEPLAARAGVVPAHAGVAPYWARRTPSPACRPSR
jgi:hypothetical protein